MIDLVQLPDKTNTSIDQLTHIEYGAFFYQIYSLVPRDAHISSAQALTTSILSHAIYREEFFGTFMFSLMTAFDNKRGLDSVRLPPCWR